MAGAAPVEPSKKGKKSLNVELNLVPFIDLLSCLIAFLLITAVWTQISSSVPAKSTGNLQVQPPPPDPNDKTIAIRVTLTEQGYTLSLQNIAKDIPKTSVNGVVTYDTKQLVDILKGVKARIPEQHAVSVAAEDTVSFQDLVTTMDQITAADLPDINILPAVN